MYIIPDSLAYILDDWWSHPSDAISILLNRIGHDEPVSRDDIKNAINYLNRLGTDHPSKKTRFEVAADLQTILDRGPYRTVGNTDEQVLSSYIGGSNMLPEEYIPELLDIFKNIGQSETITFCIHAFDSATNFLSAPLDNLSISDPDIAGLIDAGIEIIVTYDKPISLAGTGTARQMAKDINHLVHTKCNTEIGPRICSILMALYHILEMTGDGAFVYDGARCIYNLGMAVSYEQVGHSYQINPDTYHQFINEWWTNHLQRMQIYD